ncbi:hypothetical protein [Pararhodospirillum oryzae]|uniref:Uncharacterized protein n=1 Tax=Pararhodospirillum oryzae TaxID=478448 RepID=A0A512H4Q1_9PROT|nr:hypothetical protein [Pararhodospirillum oryzae]GEO80445.1 hypothetical protein ROR02_05760 [Pararhodospirillum oryzae]
MTVRLRYDTEDAIPESLRSHYAPDPAGGFVLQAEDLADTLARHASETSAWAARVQEAADARLSADVHEACSRLGVRDACRADVVRAAREAFRVDDTLTLVPLSADGPATLDAWLTTRRAESAPWWDVPTGAGVPPSRPEPGPPNPFARETLNLTEQGRLLRAQPELARRLRDQARQA